MPLIWGATSGSSRAWSRRSSTAAREHDCHYEWSVHVALAREAGVREAAIAPVAHRLPLDELADDGRLVIGYGRELLRGKRVSDGTFGAARERFGVQGVTDLTATLGYYAMLACASTRSRSSPTKGLSACPDQPEASLGQPSSPVRFHSRNSRSSVRGSRCRCPWNPKSIAASTFSCRLSTNRTAPRSQPHRRAACS